MTNLSITAGQLARRIKSAYASIPVTEPKRFQIVRNREASQDEKATKNSALKIRDELRKNHSEFVWEVLDIVDEVIVTC